MRKLWTEIELFIIVKVTVYLFDLFGFVICLVGLRFGKKEEEINGRFYVLLLVYSFNEIFVMMRVWLTVEKSTNSVYIHCRDFEVRVLVGVVVWRLCMCVFGAYDGKVRQAQR